MRRRELWFLDDICGHELVICLNPVASFLKQI